MKRLFIGICFAIGSLFVIGQKIRDSTTNVENNPTLLEGYSEQALEEMYNAMIQLKDSPNILRSFVPFDSPIYEYQHYPSHDVYEKSGYHYYYHSHREGEHGHFHTFYKGHHLMAISVDPYGQPVKLFRTDPSVTGDVDKPENLSEEIENFKVDNPWLNAIFKAFSPQMRALIKKEGESMMTLEIDEQLLWLEEIYSKPCYKL